jgi:pheromone shutdown protein TraB
MAYPAATWVAIWSGIFSAIAVGVDAARLFPMGVGGLTAWLSVIATALAWIAAGLIYSADSRRKASRISERRTTTPNPTVR